MQPMSSQACRVKADEERVNAAAAKLPQVRERASRAAAAWTAMADLAEVNEVERSRRDSAKGQPANGARNALIAETLPADIGAKELDMSEIDKTAKDGTEYRDDGSKVATEDSPSGETATEHIQRVESKLPNGGRSPDYDDPDEDDIAAPSPPTGA